MRPRAWAVVVVPVFVALGCATNKRTRTSVAALASDYRRTTDSVVERHARRAVQRGDRTPDVLILSGGGQMGAYGSGFLAAGKRAPTPRCQFR